MRQDFTSTRQIFEYLIEGGKVRRHGGSLVYLNEQGGLDTSWDFSAPEYWSKYIEPAPKIKMYLYDYQLQSSTSWYRTTAYYKSDKEFVEALGKSGGFKRRDADFIEVDDE